MTDLTYFTVSGDFRSVVGDLASDIDADPNLSTVTASVTFRPLITDGDLILATDADPRPTGFVAAPIVALIEGGQLKLRTTPDGTRDAYDDLASFPETGTESKYYVATDTGLHYRWTGSAYTEIPAFTPVRLLADTDVLELSSPLYYSVTFSSVLFNNRPGIIRGFNFQAPTSDVEVNLIEIARQPGQSASGITKIAPTAVRFDGDDMVFSFAGVDIPSPLPLSEITGPTGATGATGATGEAGTAATISVGTVSTGNAGSSASITNVGTSTAAVLDFAIPRGDTGATGETGTAATIEVGTVTTGDAGSSASITNVGTSGAAVFNVIIPRGDTGPQGIQGEQGVQGLQGVQGAAGVSLDIQGTVATYADLPAEPADGDAYVVAASGKLYFFDGVAWPSDGAGVPFVGPEGPQGVQGIQGITGATGTAATIAVGTVTNGDPGSEAEVTNTGSSSAAVFDFVIPTGQTGPTGAAATIAVGDVTTGSAGSSASVTNVGTSGAAVLDFTIPAGATGPTGPQGEQGLAGQAADIRGSVVDYAALPSTGLSDGDAYVSEDDGLLYIYDDVDGFPAEGSGVPFVGPQGPTGATGPAGADGADGEQGTVVDDVVRVGDSFQFYSGETAIGDPVSLIIETVDGGTPSTTGEGFIDGGTL